MSISVIVPTYQHASILPHALNSIFAQTLYPFEVVVVDDGSTDGTEEVVREFPEPVIYILQENRGAPAARNEGYKRSSGDRVIFWDADVVATANMLQRMSDVLDANPDASWAYSGFLWGSKRFAGREFDQCALREENYIHTTSLIERKDFPGFDESLERFQDWDLWLTMAERGHTGVYLDDFLFRVHVDRTRGGYSQWMPSIAYKFPWSLLGWAPKAIKEHRKARAIIACKHDL